MMMTKRIEMTRRLGFDLQAEEFINVLVGLIGLKAVFSRFDPKCNPHQFY